jgi:tetratricopeptide (TPR) repeat protein
MKKISVVIVLLLLTQPAFAQRKIDEAVAKAEEQFQKGKPEEAIKTLQKLVSQDPTAEPYLALGKMQERAGNIDEAAESLAKAVQLASSAPPAVKSSALAALSAMDLRHGTTKDALAHAEEAAKAQESPVSLSALARAQARLDPGAALQSADKAVQLDPRSALAQEARGEALLALHRAEEAAGAFRKALELDPKLTLARMRLAEALIAQNKAAEAVAEARKATEADPKNGEAFAILGTALLAADPKNWNEAIEQAQQGATVLDPKNPAVQVAVGKILEAHGNYDQAAASYGKAVALDPSYAPGLQALVVAEANRGNVEQAAASAQKLASQFPQNAEAQLLLGRILLRQKNLDASVALSASVALKKAVDLSPNNAEANALLGTAYQYTHRPQDAVEAYKRAVELDPNKIEYRTTYGLLLGLVGQHQAAIDILKKVVATPGYKDAAGYINLGWVYRNAEPKQVEQSIVAYQKALEIDPKNAQAALGLGWAYSYSRQWDNALAAFKKAAELDSKLAGEAEDGIAWCYFFKKEFDQAKAFLAKAQAEGRPDPHLKDSIEKIEKYIAAGETAKMREAVEKSEGPKEPPKGPDLSQLSRDVMNPSPAVRVRAAHALAAAGHDAIPYLTFLLRDVEVDVRIAAVQALATLGPGARDALPALQKALAAPPPIVTGQATAEQMKDEAKEGDFKRAIRDAIQKISGH